LPPRPLPVPSSIRPREVHQSFPFLNPPLLKSTRISPSSSLPFSAFLFLPLYLRGVPYRKVCFSVTDCPFPLFFSLSRAISFSALEQKADWYLSPFEGTFPFFQLFYESGGGRLVVSLISHVSPSLPLFFCGYNNGCGLFSTPLQTSWGLASIYAPPGHYTFSFFPRGTCSCARKSPPSFREKHDPVSFLSTITC